MLSHLELSPIQEDKSVTREDRASNSRKTPVSVSTSLPAWAAPQQPPESAEFKPLSAVKLKTGQMWTGTFLVTGQEFKWLKLTLLHLSSGGRKGLVQNWIASLFSIHENSSMACQCLKNKSSTTGVCRETSMLCLLSYFTASFISLLYYLDHSPSHLS